MSPKRDAAVYYIEHTSIDEKVQGRTEPLEAGSGTDISYKRYTLIFFFRRPLMDSTTSCTSDSELMTPKAPQCRRRNRHARSWFVLSRSAICIAQIETTALPIAHTSMSKIRI